jgi:ADP-heptose:LPS heptosyltransferase
MENFDKILYSGSLTKFFRKNEKDFNISPYLKSLEEVDNHVGKKLAKFKDTKKIGISWKSVVNIYGSLKSLKIKDFEKIISSNALFINLQYGKTEEDINNFRENGKKIYTFNDIDLFNDFDALISILKQLDVFVTVSNSTAHFAGALGIPTILICPKKSSTYYYWDYENGKTPWYKSISIVKFEDSIENTMNEVNDLIDRI